MTEIKKEQIEKLEKQLRYLERKDFYKRMAIFTLWLVNLILLIIVLLFFYNYLYKYYWLGKKTALQNELLTAVNNPVYQNIQNFLRPQNLFVSSKNVLVNKNNHYDLLAFVKNTNVYWYADIKYHFEFANYSGEMQSTYIYPQENLVLWDLNVVSKQSIRDFKLVLDDVKWRRASRFKELREKYLNFSIDSINLNKEDEADYNLTFNIHNNTIYNYHNVQLLIFFKRYDSLAYFYAYDLLDFESSENRKVKINILDDLSGVTDVQILPRLNVYDENNRYVN